jgi:hypothetical protein
MKIGKHILLVFGLGLFLPLSISAQEDTLVETETEYEEETPYVEPIVPFESTRIVSGHSTETLRKGILEFRIEHRFGDLAGDAGGVQSWFGLDNSADIRMAFEYGITDNWMVGLGRSKGNGNPYRSLLDAFTKYRILKQDRESVPLSLSVLGTTSYTYMKASDDVFQVQHFPKQAHRFAYSAQLNVTKNFGDVFTVAIMPTVVHRNYVANDDQNTIFAVGGAFRWSITKKVGFITEYYHCLADPNLRTTYTNSLGFAIEWLTFGHNFTIYVTNSTGFGETQFITNTTEDWLKGQFRLGFCIGRKFETGGE